MPTDDLTALSADELRQAYRAGDVSPVDAVEQVLQRIERLNGTLNAFVTVTADDARGQARDAEAALRSGVPLPPLFGVPVSVKDLEDTAGVVTTYGSPSFRSHVPDRDAPIWARLKAAGCILVGKTSTPDLGAKGVTESDVSGITRNPWNLDRTAGGSSGGAAVAVASGMGPLATGSDGGGSIRVPAASCGVVGLKPSIGRIPFNSRASAYDSVTTTGPLTRTVRDAALMLNATHGPDPYDPVSLLESGRDFTAGLESASVAGVRIAYSPDLGTGPVDAAMSEIVRRYVERIQVDLGAHVEEVDITLPDPMDYFYRYWGPIIAVEAEEAGLADSGADVFAPILASVVGRSAVDFARTQMVDRTAIHNEFARIFQSYDLLVCPTTPTPAFPHPALAGYPTAIGGVALKLPEADNQRLTESLSHAGYPAITIPCGLSADGLPVGLQISGGHGRDAEVLQAAAAFERAWPWGFPSL